MPKSEEIELDRGDKRYVRRDEQGQFKTEVDEGRSLSSERRQKAEHAAKPAQCETRRVGRETSGRDSRW
jgi:hypothetical protein